MTLLIKIRDEKGVMDTQEPTSGLDSATAYSLMSTLENYARLSEKTVITSIHQPSSQIYHMFTKLLLLADGQVSDVRPWPCIGLDTVGLVNITGTGRRHVIRHVGRCSRVQVDGSIEERQHKQLSYC